MARAGIGAFTEVHVIDGKLVAQGLRAEVEVPEHFDPAAVPALSITGALKLPTSSGAKVDVVIISCEEEDKRCDPEVEDEETGDWQAVAEPGTHSFKTGDLVYLVGADKVPGKDLFTWCNKFKIGEKGPLT